MSAYFTEHWGGGVVVLRPNRSQQEPRGGALMAAAVQYVKGFRFQAKKFLGLGLCCSSTERKRRTIQQIPRVSIELVLRRKFSKRNQEAEYMLVIYSVHTVMTINHHERGANVLLNNQSWLWSTQVREQKVKGSSKVQRLVQARRALCSGGMGQDGRHEMRSKRRRSKGKQPTWCSRYFWRRLLKKKIWQKMKWKKPSLRKQKWGVQYLLFLSSAPRTPWISRTPAASPFGTRGQSSSLWPSPSLSRTWCRLWWWTSRRCW